MKRHNQLHLPHLLGAPLLPKQTLMGLRYQKPESGPMSKLVHFDLLAREKVASQEADEAEEGSGERLLGVCRWPSASPSYFANIRFSLLRVAAVG